MEQSDKYELIHDLAVALRKHDCTLPAPTLAHILNHNEIKTGYDIDYEGGRGTYKLISAAYKYIHDNGNEMGAELIASAFPKSDGTFPYHQ